MPEGSEKIDRWRYAVVLAKFVVHLLHPGITKALSVLIPSLVFQLDLDYTTIGFLVPLQFSVIYLACPISNYMSTKFGPRRVTTISGFLAGISLMGAFFSYTAFTVGCSFFFAGLFSSPSRQISTVMLHEHFGEMYGMAMTFTHTGGQIGGIVLPYITVLCLDAYGMRGALLCLCGILFYQTAIGATMRPPRQYTAAKKKRGPQNIDEQKLKLVEGECRGNEEISLQNRKMGAGTEKLTTDEDSNRRKRPKGLFRKEEGSNTKNQHSKSTWTSILEIVSSIPYIDFLKRERVFTFLFLPCQILGEVSYSIWTTFCVSYGVSVGLPEKEAAYLIMAGSLGGFVGRIMLMRILYKRPQLSSHMYPVNLAISSVALFAYPIHSSLLYLLACSFVAGFGLYSSMSSYYAALSLKVEKANFPLATAATCLLCGVIFLISATLAGFIFELLGSFRIIFLITGVFLAIPCLAFTTYLYNDS